MKYVYLLLSLWVGFGVSFGKPAASWAAEPSGITVGQEKKDLLEAMHLRPDGRFIGALIEVQNFFGSGSSNSEIGIRFENSESHPSWEVRMGDRIVARVPEYPSFDDFLTALERWTQSLQTEKPMTFSKGGTESAAVGEIDKLLKNFFAPSATEALIRLNRLWREGKRTPSLISLGARAYSLLVLQKTGGTDATDPIVSRAMALLAISRVMGDSKSLIHEECLLAMITGYLAHAIEKCRSLPETDPARLWSQQDTKKITALALASGHNPSERELRFIALQSGAVTSNPKEWGDWVQSLLEESQGVFYWPAIVHRGTSTEGPDFDPLLLPSSSSVAYRHLNMDAAWLSAGAIFKRATHRLRDRFRRVMVQASLSISNVMYASQPEKKRRLAVGIQALLSPSPRGWAKTFESLLKEATPVLYSGPFLDPLTATAYFRDGFYSEWSNPTALEADLLALPDDVQEVKRIKERLRPSGDFAQQIEFWKNPMPGSYSSDWTLQAFIQALSRYQASIDARWHGFLSLRNGIDTRPGNALALYQLAQNGFLNLPWAEALYRHAGVQRADFFPGFSARFQCYSGNYQAARRWFEDAQSSFDAKVEALQCASNWGWNAAEMKGHYLRLIEQNPGSVVLSLNYLDRLKTWGEDAQVPEALKPKQVSLVDRGQWLVARGWILAKMRSQHYADAWSVLEPLLRDPGKELRDALFLDLGVLTLDRLGKVGDARKLAHSYLEKKPQALTVRLALASTFWREGAMDAAADALLQGGASLSTQFWREEVAPRFEEDFRANPKKILDAALALKSKSADPYGLREIAEALAQKGLLEPAFEISSRLDAPGLGRVDFAIASFSFLKAWKGQGPALRWLRGAMPQAVFNLASLVIAREKQWDLLWSLIPRPNDPKNGGAEELVWLFRAMAATVDPQVAPDKSVRRKDLLAHFALPGDQLNHILGKFLLGLLPEKELLALGKTGPVERCRIEYYLGLKAETEKRFNDAALWYELAFLSQQQGVVEFRWAYLKLTEWASAGRALAALSR